MGGRRQVVLLEGRLGPLMPLLAIGESCHAGSHTSLGLGRYRLHLPE
jgi:CRISPR/Cas system endoribonuclease Cas6 (RAMP superfamily)